MSRKYDPTPDPHAQPVRPELGSLIVAAWNSLSDHIAIVNGDGVIVAVNKAWRDFAASNGLLSGNVCEGASYVSVCDLAVGEDAELARVFVQGLRDVIAGRCSAFEMDYPCHSPDTQRWFAGRVTRLSGCEPAYVVVAHENSTERKQTEEMKRTQQAAMAHLSRVVTAAELTSGLAHQLNQPLGAILLYAETCRDLLKAGTQSPGTLIEPFNRLITEVERARNVVAHFTKFLRRHPLTKSTVDVNLLLKETIHLLARELGQAKVEVHYQLIPESFRVAGDPVMLEQVIVNLVTNALEAMAGAANRPRRLTVGTEVSAAGDCTVSVRDSGPGLAPSVRKRLFEAFVTSKPRGLGLGLSVSRSIIEQHGGRLWYEPADDGGAVFHFVLPVGGNAAPQQPETDHGL